MEALYFLLGSLAAAVALPWIALSAVPVAVIILAPLAIVYGVFRIVLRSILGEKKKCLIIDDDPLYASLMQELLRRSGIEADVATNAEESALIYARLNHPIILIDQNMPGMNGESTLTLLDQRSQDSNRRNDTKVVVVSSYSPQSWVQRRFDNFEIIGAFSKSNLSRIAQFVSPLAA